MKYASINSSLEDVNASLQDYKIHTGSYTGITNHVGSSDIDDSFLDGNSFIIACITNNNQYYCKIYSYNRVGVFLYDGTPYSNGTFTIYYVALISNK